MKRYSIICILAVAAVTAMLANPCAFAQEKETSNAAQMQSSAPAQAPSEATPAQAAPAAPAVKEEAPAAKEISIYGEVQAVNAPANSISIQYYDYDSDEEKVIEVTAGKDTKIENAASLDKINKGDWADVTYTVSEGKNIAKSIAVEKEETAVTEPEPEKVKASPPS